MKKVKSTFDDLITRYRLDINDSNLADSVITEMQRASLSPKLNELTKELTKFREESLPSPDFVFLRQITKIANESLYNLDINLEFRFKSAKQYGNLWTNIEDDFPSPQKDMQWPLKYSFLLLNKIEGPLFPLFFIEIYGVYRNHMNFRVYDTEYSEYADNWQHNNEHAIPVDEVCGLIPVFMRNLIYCIDKGDLDWNLFAEQDTENDDDETEDDETDEDEIDAEYNY